MTVLIVANTGWNVINYRKGFISLLTRKDHEVTVIAYDEKKGVDTTLAEMGVAFQAAPIKGAGFNPVTDFLMMLQVARTAWRIRPEVTHLFTLKPGLMAALAMRLAPSRRVVVSLTGMGEWRRKWDGPMGRALRFLARLAWSSRRVHVVVQNHDDHALLQSAGLVPDERLHIVLGSGVDVPAHAAAMPTEPPATFVMASRMLWSKGVKEFVEAGRHVHHATGGKSEFLLAGGAADHYASKNADFVPRDWLEGLGDADGVRWLGFIDPAELAQIVARARAIVHPSSYPEGIPRALLEAMAAGRPVVTLNTPGCRETVPDGIASGFRLEPGDQDGLNAACLALATDPAKAAEMGRTAHALALERFSASVINEELYGLYR